MGLVSLTPANPNDELTADLINSQPAAIAAVVNGQLDDTNIASVSGSKVANDSIAGSKISTYKVVRMDDTTTSNENSARILTGWGVITPGAVNVASEVITFGTAFTNKPVVTLTYGGDAASATTYGSGGPNIKDACFTTAHAITNTTFTARFQTRDGSNWAAGNTVFYQWTAIGV